MAEKKEFRMETSIVRVSVYRDGARVFRTGKARCDRGGVTFRVEGLTKGLIRDSVRVSGRGKGSLGAVDVATRYHGEAAHEQLKDMKKKEKDLVRRLAILKEREALVERQQQLLHSLDDHLVTEFPSWFSAGETGLPALAEFLDFTASRNTESTKTRQDLGEEIEAIEDDLAVLRARIGTHQSRTGVEESVDVLVSVEAEQAGEFSLDVSYQVRGVTWTPGYDVDLSGDTARIRGMAEVSNQSHEDWNDVTLQISTALFRPVSVVEPDPYYIDVYAPRPARSEAGARFAAARMSKAADMEPPPDEEMASEEEGDFSQKMQDLVISEPEVRESPGGIQHYDLPSTWTIPSDGNVHPVTLVTEELPSRKRLHWAASESSAVVAVNVIENGPSVLLGGKVRVFAEGEFIGETSIGQIAPGEEFELGAREDPRVKAEKKLVKREKEKGGVIKGKLSVSYRYELTVTNRTGEEADLTVMDVIPHSRSERIRVRVQDLKPESAEERMGVYTWTLTAKPSEEVKIGYGYTVEWEKGAIVHPPLP
jgi:uncharacterized protein (TIGR02231 family)